MRSYRVTYADCVLREAIVDAVSPGHAMKIVRQCVADGDHHHAIVAYESDWSAEPAEDRPPTQERCFECGAVRK